MSEYGEISEWKAQLCGGRFCVVFPKTAADDPGRVVWERKENGALWITRNHSNCS